MVERIDLGDDGVFAERADRPHDGRRKDRDLRDCSNDWRNVSEAGARNTKNDAHPELIDINESKPQERQKVNGPRRDGKDDRNRNEEDDGVQENDKIAPKNAMDEHGKRNLDLLYNTFTVLIGGAAFVDCT